MLIDEIINAIWVSFLFPAPSKTERITDIRIDDKLVFNSFKPLSIFQWEVLQVFFKCCRMINRIGHEEKEMHTPLSLLTTKIRKKLYKKRINNRIDKRKNKKRKKNRKKYQENRKAECMPSDK